MARSTKIKSKLIAEDSVEFSQLTPETVPVLDADKNIVSSTITPTELENLSGTTSPIQDQLDDEAGRITEIEENSKVLKVYAYENNSQIFADGEPGIKDPSALIRDGWYFKNTVAGDKINWYYFDGLNQGTVTLGELDTVYAIMTFDSISSPIIAIYTLPTGTGDVIPGFAHSRIVYDGAMTPTPTIGKQYLVYGGVDPSVHPELPRIHLAKVLSQSIGEQLPEEQVLTISFGSASGAAVNQVQYMVETLGLFTAPVKHEMDLRIQVASQLDLDTHVNDASNPHSVTKDQVGLGDVDNTSDLDKPISTATQDALDLKVSKDGDTMTGDLIQDNGSGGTNTLTPEGQFIVGGDLITEYSRLGYYINLTPTGSTFQKVTDGGIGYLTLTETDSSTNASKTIDIQLSGISMNESLDGSPATPIMPTNEDHVVVKKYVDDNFVSTTGDTMTGPLTMLDTSIIIDGTITQGYPSTVEISTNFVGINDNNGVDAKETSFSAGLVTLSKTSIDSSNVDTTLTIGVDGTLINSTTVDYANQIQSQLIITDQAVNVASFDEVTEISKNTVIGVDGFVIQSTNADTSYVLIEASTQGISATNFDTTNVTPLMPTLPEHYVVKQYVDDLVSGGETDLLEKFQVMKEPTGFVDRTSSITSFNDLTREFTIQPTAASYEVYVQATKFTKSSAETITIDNISGNHYIYFNSAGVLSSTQILNADLFQNNALISIIYWNTDTSTHSYFAEERHGLTLDGATHSYLHTVFGAQYLSGLALQNFVINGTGSLTTEAQFTADEGTIRDEDLVITIPAQTQIPVLYRQGTLWRKKTADAFPMIYNGTAGYTGSRLPYNQLVSGSWQLTEISNNGFVLIHVFGTNDKETPIVAIQGIAEYGNVTAARLAASSEITSLSGLPFAEFVALGSVVVQTANAFTNTPKATTISVNGGNYVDFRGTQLYTPAGVATSHNLLSGLSSDDHIQYHTDARGDARYYTKAQVDSLIGASGSPGDIAETQFSLSNLQTTPENITNFAFANATVRGFTALVTVEIDATTELFEQFTLNGIQKNGSWNMSIESIGDNTGIVFSITSSGQIQYVSPSYVGFTSADVKFRAITTSF